MPTKLRKTILLVDDDAAIRSALVALLNRKGIGVLTAATVEDAISLLEREPTIEGLVVDLNLSQSQCGTEVAMAALEIRPDLHCIFMSGYPMLKTDIAINESRLIRKPFEIQALIEMLDCEE